MKKLQFLSLFIAIVLGCSFVSAQESENPKKPMVKNEVEISLSIKKSESRKQNPYLMKVTLENISDEPIDIRGGAFTLEEENQTEKERRRLGPNYWSPVSIRQYIISDNKKTFKSTYYLQPKEKAELEIDISKTKWGQSGLSGYPAWKLKKAVPSGTYDLYFEFQISYEEGKARTYKSNQLKFTIKWN